MVSSKSRRFGVFILRRFFIEAFISCLRAERANRPSLSLLKETAIHRPAPPHRDQTGVVEARLHTKGCGSPRTIFRNAGPILFPAFARSYCSFACRCRH
jgi:hypothetical protein